jgi:imidazoleglycerol phosphate dehydratase HisB
MLDQVAKHSGSDLSIHVKVTYIDEHTIEDVRVLARLSGRFW